MYAGSQVKLYRDPGLRSIGSFGSNGSSDTHMASNVSVPLPVCRRASSRKRDGVSSRALSGRSPPRWRWLRMAVLAFPEDLR